MTGFYNLPQEDQDKYNRDPTQEELRDTWEKSRAQKVNRSNKMISPLSQETLTSFAKRMDVNDKLLEEQATQEHMFGVRGAWYVHKRPQNCFICDLITANTQKAVIIQDLLKSKPNRKKAFGSEESQHSSILRLI